MKAAWMKAWREMTRELISNYREEGVLFPAIAIPVAVGSIIGINVQPWWLGVWTGLMIAIGVWGGAGALFFAGQNHAFKEQIEYLNKLKRDAEREAALREWSRLRR